MVLSLLLFSQYNYAVMHNRNVIFLRQIKLLSWLELKLTYKER